MKNFGLATTLRGAACLLLVVPGACAGHKRAAETSVVGDSEDGVAGASGSGGAMSVDAPSNLPPPPRTGVPRPDAAVTSPELQVLPWAGFSAAISYTFDDTQPSQAEHASELVATGVPLTFFANPSGNWQAGFDATWREVAASGSEIGNHTWSHCHADLSDCTPIGTQQEEIDQATDYIISSFGVPAVYSFAAPFGDSGWDSYAASRFLLGRGVISGTVAASGASDWYNLPCIAVTAGQTESDFSLAIDKAHDQGRWGIFMFHSILPTSNNWYAGVELADVTASIEHAKSLSDVWIDSIGEVGAYLKAQQMFEGLTPSGNTWTWTLPEHFPPGKSLRVSVAGGTLSQAAPLAWDPHGYYEVALDAGRLSWAP